MLLKFILFVILSIFLSTLFYQILSYFRNRKFNQYFQIISDESYNLDDLFHIKLTGEIIPKMDYLDIPYDELTISIQTPTILGVIKQNQFYVQLIRPRHRKKALELVKLHYMKTVAPYIRDTIQNKREDIQLINLSKRHLPKIKKLACNTCRYKIQCRIAFTECNYEREKLDTLLEKGIVVKLNRSTNLSHYKK